MSRGLAVSAILAAASIWGTAGAAQELAVPAGSPTAVGALRCLTGGGLLALVAAWRGGRVPREVRGPLAVGSVAMVVFQAGYLGGIRITGVAVGTLVAIGSAPVWAGAIALLRGQRTRPAWAAATLVTVLGLIAVVAPGAGTIAGAGVLASLAAGAGYAAYVAATAELRGRIDPFAMLAVIFLVAGAVLLLTPGGRSFGLDGTVAVAGHLWLALGTIALAYLLFATGLRGVDAPTATTLTLAEPLTATLLAVLVVGEVLTGLGAAGVALLVLGLAGTARVGPAAARVPSPNSTLPDTTTGHPRDQRP